MQTYEQLKGGEGRLIHYRPERFRAKDVFTRGVPELMIGNQPLDLHDLSISGLGAQDHCGGDWSERVGERLPVRITVRGEVLHQSMCEIRRGDRQNGCTVVGARLIDRHLDIAGLVEKYRESLLRNELAFNTAADLHHVSGDYRRLCADVVHLLRHCRTTLERMDEAPVSAAPARGSAVGRVLEYCEEQLLPRWRDLWFEANQMLWDVLDDPARLRATKKFTEAVVTPELLGGPIWWRGYCKPLGYPGDYLLMKQIYDRKWEGETPYGKIAHRLGLDIGEFVANRMLMMKDEIAETVFTKAGRDAAHITSLGAGPAQEVVSYLDAPTLPGSVAFTLIDQDRQALDLAYGNAHRRVLSHGGEASVNCLWTSFVQLLRPGAFLDELPPQDLIYSVGLIDYLTDRRVAKLVETLYARLAPGGRLVLGNVKRSEESSMWPLEFVADWSLIYRTEADMARLAGSAADARREILSDDTNRVVVMRLTKPGGHRTAH